MLFALLMVVAVAGCSAPASTTVPGTTPAAAQSSAMTTQTTTSTMTPSSTPSTKSNTGSTPAAATNEQKVGDLTVTDMLGRKVTVPKGADSFVAIGPGCLRLYSYVGDVSKLTGIEKMEADDVTGRPYIMANKQLQKLPIIGLGGPTNAPDAEKLLVNGPDVIFTLYKSDVSAVDELQQKTGIPVVALSYGTSVVFDPDLDKSLTLIGQVTGREKRASEIIAYFASLKNDLSSRTTSIPKEERPLAYVGGLGAAGVHGIESTNGNFALFNVLGVRNAVTEAGINKSIMLDKEKLLEMNPNFIFIDGSGLQLVTEDYTKNKSFYNQLDAFKNGRVFLTLPYNYYSTNIDVAIADAYYIGTIVYPKQFADVKAEGKFDEIMNKLHGTSMYAELSKMFYGGYHQLKF
jgi:iron complex transport system substrate-binding protein